MLFGWYIPGCATSYEDIMTCRNTLIACLLCLVLPSAIGAELRDLATRNNKYHNTYVINEDGTASETREWAMTILKESALKWAKRAHVTHSTSAQRADVLAAYTQKPDGRRIDVPKDNYQIEINSGREKGAPVYSDMTTVSVVFPDVAVGDTLVFSYRLVQTEPLFPKHFSVAEHFSRQVAFDDVRIRIDYPASLWVQYESRSMTEQAVPSSAGRKAVEFSYKNPQPQKSERRDWSVFDPEKEPGYAFTTFKDYAEIAAAYGARALPKAAVTPRIARLAEEIVKGKTAPREQARALYDWVATNITYAGNCIGVGAVVPRDLDFVLDNKMGDCKDQATLLQSLLAARNIRSTQALVNSGTIYRLPKIPVVSTINHVINYLPQLDLFADATSKTIPFGMLPFQDSDKPVLLVEGHKDGTRTPPTPLVANRQKTVSRLVLHENGSISGTIDIQQKGYNATDTRAMARSMTKDAEEEFVKNMFRAMGMVGFGKLEKDDPTELTDSYRYKASINVERFAASSGAGAFYVYPLLDSASTIHGAIQSGMAPEPEADVACLGGVLDEEYNIELPKKMKVLSIPDNLKLANDFLSYSANYRLKGRTLIVRRTLDDRTKGNVCSPAVFAEFKKFADKVMDNLKAQVLYKY